MIRNKIYIKEKCFSQEVIRRLSLYLRDIERFKANKVKVISSKDITKILNVSSSQFRKDLSYFGGFGKKGVGYEVDVLITEIKKILGIQKNCHVALVGVGKLGGALLGFDGFSRLNLSIKAAFDCDRRKIGKVQAGVKIEDVCKLRRIIKKTGIRIGIICTPSKDAQEIAESMVSSGIKAILNFAPVEINISKRKVYISNMDMAAELGSLAYFVK